MNPAIEITSELCKRFEGFRSKPYICPAGVPTIGYGSTYYPDGKKVTLTDPPVTEKQATDMLMHELLVTFAPGAYRACPTLYLAGPYKAAAIVDFAYNLGVGRLQASTLRRKINEQNWDAACDELRKWVLAGGKRLPGLVLRREAEVALMKRE